MPKARYLDLADRLAAAIQNGKLAPGTRLPTHRAFAEQFNVALATASRTYNELERRGVVVGEAGRGTFVRDVGLPITLGVHQIPPDGLIDLVFNMPGAAADADTLRAGLRRLASAGDIDAMLRYQPHGGRAHERRIIADYIGDTRAPIDPVHVLITSGGQHGLAIIAFGLLKRGGAVAVDPLTYPGFKSVAALQGLTLVPVDSQGGVMDPDALDRACRSRSVSAVYLMPTVHNPLGSVMDIATRHHLIQIARRHDLLIIEDAAYAFLETDAPDSLMTLAPERTVHVGGFSKSFATGLRLGYVIAPPDHAAGLLEAIRATTWNAPALISALFTGWIEDGTLRKSEQRRRMDGAQRQQILRSVFDDLICTAHRNAGFAWLPLEKGVRAQPIVSALKEDGISVSGAELFATDLAVPQALRLAFGGIAIDELAGVLGAVRNAVLAAPTG